MAQETKWFTKTIARDEITALANGLVEDGELSQETAAQFIALFASKRKGGGVSTTVTVDGVIIGKKCSYLQRYLPISEFGTLGKDDKGEVKYAYQSKEGAKLARKAKAEFEEAIASADLALEETEDIAEWKQAKLDAKAEFEADVVSELGFETAEELTEA